MPTVSEDYAEIKLEATEQQVVYTIHSISTKMIITDNSEITYTEFNTRLNFFDKVPKL